MEAAKLRDEALKEFSKAHRALRNAAVADKLTKGIVNRVADAAKKLKEMDHEVPGYEWWSDPAAFMSWWEESRSKSQHDCMFWRWAPPFKNFPLYPLRSGCESQAKFTQVVHWTRPGVSPIGGIASDHSGLYGRIGGSEIGTKKWVVTTPYGVSIESTEDIEPLRTNPALTSMLWMDSKRPTYTFRGDFSTQISIPGKGRFSATSYCGQYMVDNFYIGGYLGFRHSLTVRAKHRFGLGILINWNGQLLPHPIWHGTAYRTVPNATLTLTRDPWLEDWEYISHGNLPSDEPFPAGFEPYGSATKNVFNGVNFSVPGAVRLVERIEYQVETTGMEDDSYDMVLPFQGNFAPLCWRYVPG